MFRAVLRSQVPSVPVKKSLPYRAIAIRPHICTFTSTCSMPSKKDDKYTDPELREEVKEEIQAGDKGGAPGQWSARKVLGPLKMRYRVVRNACVGSASSHTCVHYD
jgi:hypothetical protein